MGLLWQAGFCLDFSCFVLFIKKKNEVGASVISNFEVPFFRNRKVPV
jgi:hypothetical protein